MLIIFGCVVYQWRREAVAAKSLSAVAPLINEETGGRTAAGSSRGFVMVNAADILAHLETMEAAEGWNELDLSDYEGDLFLINDSGGGGGDGGDGGGGDEGGGGGGGEGDGGRGGGDIRPASADVEDLRWEGGDDVIERENDDHSNRREAVDEAEMGGNLEDVDVFPSG